MFENDVKREKRKKQIIMDIFMAVNFDNIMIIF